MVNELVVCKGQMKLKAPTQVTILGISMKLHKSMGVKYEELPMISAPLHSLKSFCTLPLVVSSTNQIEIFIQNQQGINHPATGSPS